jgi:hypothetical protein
MSIGCSSYSDIPATATFLLSEAQLYVSSPLEAGKGEKRNHRLALCLLQPFSMFQSDLDRELADAVRRGLLVDEDFERGTHRAVRIIADTALAAAVAVLAVTLQYVCRPSVTPGVHLLVRLCVKHFHVVARSVRLLAS